MTGQRKINFLKFIPWVTKYFVTNDTKNLNKFKYEIHDHEVSMWNTTKENKRSDSVLSYDSLFSI